MVGAAPLAVGLGGDQPAQALGAQMSALVIADRLLTLAQDAERAGLMDAADHLVRLAHDVFDEEAGVDVFDGAFGTEF